MVSLVYPEFTEGSNHNILRQAQDDRLKFLNYKLKMALYSLFIIYREKKKSMFSLVTR